MTQQAPAICATAASRVSPRRSADDDIDDDARLVEPFPLPGHASVGVLLPDTAVSPLRHRGGLSMATAALPAAAGVAVDRVRVARSPLVSPLVLL